MEGSVGMGNGLWFMKRVRGRRSMIASSTIDHYPFPERLSSGMALNAFNESHAAEENARWLNG